METISEKRHLRKKWWGLSGDTFNPSSGRQFYKIAIFRVSLRGGNKGGRGQPEKRGDNLIKSSFLQWRENKEGEKIIGLIVYPSNGILEVRIGDGVSMF